jgi:subtilisin family serine protease
MATPFVAAQAAHILSLNPTLNPRQVAWLIAGTAENLDPINPPYEDELGAGMVDFAESIAVLQSGNLPTDNNGIMSGSCVENSVPPLGDKSYLPILLK